VFKAKNGFHNECKLVQIWGLGGGTHFSSKPLKSTFGPETRVLKYTVDRQGTSRNVTCIGELMKDKKKKLGDVQTAYLLDHLRRAKTAKVVIWVGFPTYIFQVSLKSVQAL